jgi:hypothetical protein
MNRIAWSFVAIVFATSLPAHAQGSAPDPQALLAAVKVASGGNAWDSAAEIAVQGTATGQGLAGTFSAWTDLRTGYSRSEFKAATFGFQGGQDANGPWHAINGILQADTSPAALREAQTTKYVNRNGWWNVQNDPATFAYAGQKANDGKTYDVVSVVPQGGERIDVWIDRATHLIGRYILYGDANQQQISTFSDYRKVDGIMYPFSEVNGNGNPKYDQVGTALHVNVMQSAVATDFARPAPHLTGQLAAGASTALPFEMTGDDGGHIIVSATVDGKGPLHLVFDSGGANILTPNAAARLGVKSVGSVPVGGAGSQQVSAGIAKVNRLAVGTASLADQQFLVLQLPYSIVGELHAIPIDGLIGYEMLKNFVVTIDYANRTIAFADPATFHYTGRGTAIPFTTSGNVPLIPAKVNGIDGIFQLDTGNAGMLILFGDFVKAHGLDNGRGLTLTAPGGIGGTNDVRIIRVQTLDIGPYTLHGPAASLTHQASGALASQTTAGNIGAAILSRFTLTFDYAHSTVYFEPNADLANPLIGNRLGFSLVQPAAGTLRVLSVAPNTPAQAAGIQAGDTIVSIAGTRAADLGVADVARLASHSPTLTIVFAHAGKTTTMTIPTQDLVGAPGS